MKYKFSLIFASMIGISALAVFYLWNDVTNAALPSLLSQKPRIDSYLTCPSGTLNPSIGALRKNDYDPVDLIVTMSAKPSVDVIDYLEQYGVFMQRATWNDYHIAAKTTVAQLCFLQAMPGVLKLEPGEAL